MNTMSDTETASNQNSLNQTTLNTTQRTGTSGKEIEVPKPQMRGLHQMETGVRMVGRGDEDREKMQRSSCGAERVG